MSAWKKISKLLIVIVVTLAVIGFLFGTEIGLRFVNFVKIGGEKVLSSILGLTQKTEGKITEIRLSIDSESLAGKVFTAVNTSISISGNCDEVMINNAKVLTPTSCAMQFQNANGSINFDSNLKGKLNAPLFAINNLSFVNVNTQFSILPEEFYISNISQNKILINIKRGVLTILNDDGSIRCTINYQNEVLELRNYVGSLEFKNGTFVLIGTSTFTNICTPK